MKNQIKYDYTFFWTSEGKLLESKVYNDPAVKKIKLHSNISTSGKKEYAKINLPSCLKFAYTLQVTGPNNIFGDTSDIRLSETLKGFENNLIDGHFSK